MQTDEELLRLLKDCRFALTHAKLQKREDDRFWDDDKFGGKTLMKLDAMVEEKFTTFAHETLEI